MRLEAAQTSRSSLAPRLLQLGRNVVELFVYIAERPMDSEYNAEANKGDERGADCRNSGVIDFNRLHLCP
jgi:hypothetical protein